MGTNEIDISIKEIDNGYTVHAAKGDYTASLFASNRAIVGSKDDAKTTEELLQFVCEEILFKLLGRTKSFGGRLHGRVNVSVSFTEDPTNPVEMH